MVPYCSYILTQKVNTVVESRVEYEDRIERELSDALQLKRIIAIGDLDVAAMLEHYYPRVLVVLAKQLLKGSYTSEYDDCHRCYYLKPTN